MFVVTKISKERAFYITARFYSRVWVVDSDLVGTKNKLLFDVEKANKQDYDIGLTWKKKGDKKEELNMSVSSGGTSTFNFILEQKGENQVEIKELDHDYAFAHSFFKNQILQGINEIIKEIGAIPK